MKKIIYLAVLLVIFLFGFLNVADAVNLPWSTSFIGCGQDALYSSPGTWAGCGDASDITTTVYTTIAGTSGILTAANFPGGAGERGWRRYVAGGAAGGGNTATSGTFSLSLNNEHEIWVLWYMRWQTGFEWNNSGGLGYQKIIYIRPFGGVVLDLIGPDNWTIEPQSGNGTGSHGANHHVYSSQDGSITCSSCGWNAMNSNGAMQTNGIRLGDDSWHAIEVHFKDQSGSGTYDGVFDLWLDGVLRWHVTGVNWYTGSPSGVGNLQFMINQATPSNPVPMYNDIDDMTISNTGYIVPIRPSPAQNLR